MKFQYKHFTGRDDLNKISHSSKNRRIKRFIILGFIILAFSALCISAFYSGLTVRNYDITSEKLPEDASLRIVVIADLHSVYYGENQQQLIEKIKEQQPDLIALPGDIFDDHTAEDGAVALLDGMQGIAPTYYVTGNHEIWSGKHQLLKDMVAGYGYTVLSNESKYITVDGIKLCICGIDDPYILEYSDEEEIRAMQSDEELLDGFESLDNDTFNILLAHRPERFGLYQQYAFDLVLSGHAHGGQIRIPGIVNGFFAPNQGLFPKYAGGEYNENGQTMIVSRGLAFNEVVPRVFNPPEIVVIDIQN